MKEVDCTDFPVYAYEWNKMNADETRFDVSVRTDQNGKFKFWAPSDIQMSVYMGNTYDICWRSESTRIRTTR